MNFFPDTILLLDIYALKDIQVGRKLMRWWTIIRIAVISSAFKKDYAKIVKDDLQYLVTPTN